MIIVRAILGRKNGRSRPRDAIEAVATRDPDLVRQFGGHAMAAGLSLPADSLGRFSSAFDDEARRRLAREALLQVHYTDGNLSPTLAKVRTATAAAAGTAAALRRESNNNGLAALLAIIILLSFR